MADHSCPVDQEADAGPLAFLLVQPPAAQGWPTVWVDGHRKLKAHALDRTLDIFHFQWSCRLVMIDTNHHQSLVLVAGMELVQGGRGSGAEWATAARPPADQDDF